MIDALGIERDHGMPFCEQGKRYPDGLYALVRHPDGSGLWRFRDGVSDTIEAPEHDHTDLYSFRQFVLDHPERVRGARYQLSRATSRPPKMETSRPPKMDWLGISGHLIGTAIMVGPIALIVYQIFRILGWI